MQSFSVHYKLMTEAIRKSDIIDLYIILAMPKIEDPAFNFVADEVVKETSGRILAECEHVVLGELRHINRTNEFYIIKSLGLKDLKRVLKIAVGLKKQGIGLLWQTAAEKAFSNYSFSQDLALKLGHVGKSLNLPPFDSKSAKIWYNTFKNLLRVEAYLNKHYPEEGEEDQIKETNELTFDRVSKSLNLNLTPQIVENLFRNLRWEPEYGGKAWAEIATALSNLKSATSPKKFIFYLDRLVDMVHNSNTVLDKFKGYDQGWLVYLLDLKAHALNIKELIPYASRDVQKLFKTQEWRLATRHMNMIQGASESFTGLEQALYYLFVKKNKNTSGPPNANTVIKFLRTTKFQDQIPRVLELMYSKLKDPEKVKFKRAVSVFLSGHYAPYIYSNPTKNKKNLIGFFDYISLYDRALQGLTNNEKLRLVDLYFRFYDTLCKLTGEYTSQTKYNFISTSYPVEVDGQGNIPKQYSYDYI